MKAGGDNLDCWFNQGSVAADVVKRAGPRVAEAFGAKGGGRPGLYQGKTNLLGNAAAAKAVLDSIDDDPNTATGPQPS